VGATPVSKTQNGAERPDTSARRRICQGPLLPIGGAEETEPGGEILERFIAEAGGEAARIAIIPTASNDPKRSGEGYAKLFREMGAAAAEWLAIDCREQANSDDVLARLGAANGIFITGGDQARLVALLVGTRLMECLRERNAAGVLIAGTSAGASILSAHMMLGGTGIGGDSSDAAARKGMAQMVGGFGLIDDVIIDQHFSERGRMGRLLALFAANPGLVGIGLDQDTAALTGADGVLEVLGSGMVTIVDGRDATSDYFERDVGEVLTVVRSSLHVLAAGRRFDLVRRQPIDFS
jgi:cyanophycinase